MSKATSTMMRALLLSACALMMISGNSAVATVRYFNGGSSTTWDQVGALANWGTVTGGPYNTAWVGYDDAVWEGTGAAINVASAANVNTMQFNADGYTLGGSTITLGSPSGGATFSVSSTYTATINSNFAHTSNTSWSKNGTGTLNYGGTDTGAGAVVINNGTLGLTGGTLTTSSDFYVAGSGFQAATTNLSSFTLSSGTMTVNGSNFLLGQNVNGSTKVAQFTQTNGSFSYTPTGGFIGIGNGGGVSQLDISGGTFTASNSSGMNLGVRGNSTLNISGTAVVTMPKLIFGHGSTAGATNTTNLDGGTLSVDSVSKGSGTATFNFNGGTLKARTGASGATFMTGLNTATVNSGGAIIDTNTFNITIGQALLAGSPSGGLTKNNTGTLTLTGANTYTGNTVVNAGTLQVGNGSNTGSLASASATSVVGGATLEFYRNDTSELSIGNVISGAGTLSFRGTGTTNQSAYALTATNSGFTGPVSITAARLNINSVNDIGPGTVTIDNGGQAFLSAGSYANSFNITGDGWSESAGVLGAIRFAGGATVSGGITLQGNSRITAYAGGDSGTISGAITDGTNSFNLEKTGSGTITLSVSNSYDGTTTLSGGVLQINQNNSISNNTLILNGGTLRAGNGARTIAMPVTANAGTTSGFDTPTGNNLTVNGNISGSGNINKSGAFSVFLGGSNSGYTGTYTNTASNTFFNSAGASSAAAAWVVNSGILANTLTGNRTLDLGSLGGTGGQLGNNVGSSAITYSIGALNTDTTYSGAIVNNVGGGGTIAVTKVGTGTLTLAGNNTFTGGLTINNGAVRVGSNGTTGTLGNGTITNNGEIIYNRTDTVSVGAIAGTGDITVRSGTVNFNNSLTPTNLVVNPGSIPNTGANTLTVGNTFNQAGNQFSVVGGSMGVSGANLATGGNVALSGGVVTLTPAQPTAVNTLPVTSGLRARFDASSITGLSNGQTVSTWNDISGNGNHATLQAGTPEYQSSVLNGQPVVRFDTDGNSWFSFSNMTDIRTVFWVVKENAVGNHFLLGDDGQYHFHRGGSNLWDGNTSGNVRSGTTRLMGDIVDGTVTALGSGYRLVSVTTTGNVEASRINNDRGIASRSWDGDMAELLIYNQALTAAQIQQVEQFLNHKYALGTNYDPLSLAGNAFTSGSTLAVNNSTTLDLSNATTVSLGTATVASGQVLTLTTTGTNNYTGDVAGAGGLTKAGIGTVTLSNNHSYAGNTLVGGGTLSLSGAFTNNIANSPTVTVAADATLDVTGLTGGALLLGGSQLLKGNGSVLGTVGGSGTVAPGSSPGILAVTATDPTGGLDYAFEISSLGDPTWSNASGSLNDVLRLTSGTAPLTAALSAGNTLTVDFNLPSLSIGDVFRGGLYTDLDSDFTSLQSAGDWQYTFSNAPLPGGAMILRSVVQVASADFASGTITDGWVTQFQVVAVPEPGSFAMLIFGSVLLWRVVRRRRMI